MERDRRAAFIAATSLLFDAADENDISLADVLDNAPENAPANESELDNLNDEHQDEDKVLDEGAVIPFEHNE